VSGHQYEQLSCGACGCAEHRLLWEKRSDGSVRGIKAVCCGCGCVTHILPPNPTIKLFPGRVEEGENDEGLLAPMPWKDRDDLTVQKVKDTIRDLQAKAQEWQDVGVDATSQQEEDRALARAGALREAANLIFGTLPRNRTLEDKK